MPRIAIHARSQWAPTPDPGSACLHVRGARRRALDPPLPTAATCARRWCQRSSTETWQTATVHLANPTDFRVDENFFVVPRLTEGRP